MWDVAMVLVRPLGSVVLAWILTLGVLGCESEPEVRSGESTYEALVLLFQEWREFERPGLLDGAPDYTASSQERRLTELAEFQGRLDGIDPTEWPIPQQVDYHLVRAEMNGMEFHQRVLHPWARDPAFYASVRPSQSDTPAEEGPTIHYALRLWEYSIWPRTRDSEIAPLTPEAVEELTRELDRIPPLLEQARGNLRDSDARDLWEGGIRRFEIQSGTLSRLSEVVGSGNPELELAVESALAATDEFTEWLRTELPSKTGPSGVGREQYTWHMQNVLLLPLTWDDEVAIVRKELARAHSTLRLEEHRNRDLPELHVAQDAEEFAQMQAESLRRYMTFLVEHEILHVEDWMEHSLGSRTRDFLPPETRTFFGQVRAREPKGLWTHWYHWWDLDRMEIHPHESPIRREALRYNVWMSRAEGMATVMEEWMMHAGLYDESPRSREIIWIMLATRAARGLASLYAHANELTMEEAGDLHVEWTPRGWMRRDLDLLGFEQHLYLRQPGYGPSYVTGARLMDELLAERALQLGDDFTLQGFFREVNDAGMIPVPLLKWELTGNDAGIEALRRAAERPFPTGG